MNLKKKKLIHSKVYLNEFMLYDSIFSGIFIIGWENS